MTSSRRFVDFRFKVIFLWSLLATAATSPQQLSRNADFNFRQFEVQNRLYNTPTVPPPPARAPAPATPERLYESPDASDNSGSILFPLLDAAQPPPPPPAPAPPPPAPVLPPPAPRPRPPPPAPAPAPTQGGAMVGMPYDFDWQVNDQESGNVYSHNENSDGSVTTGEYRVLLPDGRLQIVSFVDRGNGYEATVTYQDYSGGLF